MNVLDLFSGIGGFSLGLEQAGMRTVAFCEIDPYCQCVLRRHWPDVPVFGDVRELTAEVLANAYGIGCKEQNILFQRRFGVEWNGIDVICGGFPCQDISVAGKGAGITGERSGLWSEYARIIGQVRPRYVIVENVAALLGRGLSVVLGDLAALGYDAEWHCIPACAIGAPHRRDRVWIVAYPTRDVRGEQATGVAERERAWQCGESSDVEDTAGQGWRSQRAAVAAEENGGRAFGEFGGAGDVADANGAGQFERWRPLPIQEELLAAQCGSEDVAYAARDGRREDEFVLAGTQSDGQEAGRAARSYASIGRQWLVEPDVCGVVDGLSPRLDGGVNGQGMDTLGDQTAMPERRLRTVWRQLSLGAASQGQGSDEQLARKLADALPDLPYAIALAGGQGAMEAASRFLHRMRQACEAAGALRDTSEPIVEAWQSLSEDEAERAFLASCGRTDWRSGEWLGVGRVAQKVPARVDRLRALGNAIVPQIAEVIGRAIMRCEAEIFPAGRTRRKRRTSSS